MEEPLKNLTVEMVEELKELGVEFEDPQQLWIKFYSEKYNLISREKANNDMLINVTAQEVIPAPNLQEVLEKLPNHIDVKIPKGYLLEVRNGLVGYFPTDSYSQAPFPIYSCENKNTLVAVYRVLLFMAVNYPSVLKIKN